MEQTFLTIHNLRPEANILFASESITDILGYSPEEVHGKSCFDYFHPDEVPFARSVHSRGVLLDKAAVLHYARVLASDGRWVSCECCFTVVHDVLVACTSIYRRGFKSERRAIEAPQIRRIFSCSLRDPRYHMLEHLSPKFKTPPMEREPRAGLILNRFTRNLTIMFATNAVSAVLGLRPDEIRGLSFYRCIQEHCIAEVARCLESAKANDSIAYLRFWYQDPRDPAGDEEDEGGDKEGMNGEVNEEIENRDEEFCDAKEERIKTDLDGTEMDVDLNVGAVPETCCRSKSPATAAKRARLFNPAKDRRSAVPGAGSTQASIELEAVVSCTSDGLVVVLRKARPPIPAAAAAATTTAHRPLRPDPRTHGGLFDTPGGHAVVRPPADAELWDTFRTPMMPEYMPLRDCVKGVEAAPSDQLMRSIRDVAVFAWALAGINSDIAAAYGRGMSHAEGLPPDVWDRQAHFAAAASLPAHGLPCAAADPLAYGLSRAGCSLETNGYDQPALHLRSTRQNQPQRPNFGQLSPRQQQQQLHTQPHGTKHQPVAMSRTNGLPREPWTYGRAPAVNHLSDDVSTPRTGDFAYSSPQDVGYTWQ